jgi:hypothetical protein
MNNSKGYGTGLDYGRNNGRSPNTLHYLILEKRDIRRGEKYVRRNVNY